MIDSKRRSLLAAAAAVALPGLASAQPDRNAVRILVGFAPGGGTDLVARLLADKLRDELDQPVVVENLPGAGGRLAANALLAAPPSGNTYMMANNAVMTFQTLVFGHQVKWNYKSDFVPVAGLTTYPLGLAVPAGLGVGNLQDLARWFRANPAKNTFGTTGLGGVTHFLGVELGRGLGIELEPVPYRGATPMVGDLVGGHLPAAIGLMDDMLKFHRAGSVKVIGIFSARRSPLIPDIPTLREQGAKVVESEGWQGMWAPARAPAAQTDRMAAALRKVLDNPEVRQAMTARLNVQPTFRTGSEVGRLLDAEIAQWEKIIKASGFKAE